MEPKWLQYGSLETSRRAPTLLPDPPGNRPGEALARPGASQKLFLAAVERPWSERLIDFTLLEPPGRVPEGLWEVILKAFCGWAGGNETTTRNFHKTMIWEAVFACVLLPLPCVFCSPRRSPGAKAEIDKWVHNCGFI